MARIRRMDLVTQAVLGAAVGEALLGRKLGNRALLWGAAAGLLPEIRLLIHPLLPEIWRRWLDGGPFHSLAFVALAAILLPRWLVRVWKKAKITRGRAGAFIALAGLASLAVGALSIRGNALLWPLSDRRFGLGLLPENDFLPALLLLPFLLLLARHTIRRDLPKRSKLLLRGSLLLGAYLLLAGGAKWSALRLAEADLAARGLEPRRSHESAGPWSILFRRSLVETEDEIWIARHGPFPWPRRALDWVRVPREKQAFAAFADEREARMLDRLSEGWWIAREHKQGLWLADLRFGERREWDARPGTVDLRPLAAWQLRPDERRRLQPDGPMARHRDQSNRRLARHLLGDDEAWLGEPRLAGVPGSQPEPLWREPALADAP